MSRRSCVAGVLIALITLEQLLVFSAQRSVSSPSYLWVSSVVACSCWSSSLDNVMRQHAKKASSRWFSLYQLMERYLEEESSTSDPGTRP